MLDSNVFDRVVEHESDRRAIISLVKAGDVRLFTTYVQEGELFELAERSPEKYWRIASVPRRELPASVFVLDHTPLGAGRLGSGVVYGSIRHKTSHIDDAVIADTAAGEGLTLVTDDARLLRRAAALPQLTVVSSDVLLVRIRSLCAQ
jgi:predicted nucleic acid-binding protein